MPPTGVIKNALTKRHWIVNYKIEILLKKPFIKRNLPAILDELVEFLYLFISIGHQVINLKKD